MNQLEKLAVDMKELTPYLLSGGAGALATGLAVSKLKRDPKKSRLADLAKKLAIVLGGGAVAAGAHKAINSAMENFQTALPAEDVATEEKITSVVGNPNTLRLGVGSAAAAGLYGHGRRADNKELKSLFNFDVGNNPTQFTRDQIAGMQGGGNKLDEFLDIHTRMNMPKVPALGAISAEIDTIQNQLKSRNLPSADKANLMTKLTQLQDDKIKLENNVFSSAREGFKGRLQRGGIEAGDFSGSKFDKLKQSLRVHGGRVIGRTGVARVAKPAALAAALLSPEMAQAAMSMLTSNPSVDVPE
jgi:hypothetical protein